MNAISAKVISCPGHRTRINEDGWLTMEEPGFPGWLFAVVIDGASARLTLPTLNDYLNTVETKLTPAAFVTKIVKNTFINMLKASLSDVSLDQMLKNCNSAVREAMKNVPGFHEVFDILEGPILPLADALDLLPASLRVSLGSILEAAFTDTPWMRLDSRYLRLFLPACVLTVVRLNTSTGEFSFSHIGDTLLLYITRAGDFLVLSRDQMRKFDEGVLRTAMEAVDGRGSQIKGVMQAFQESNTVQELNLLNGMRHNYVDESGTPRPGEGCGVINGLSQMESYMQMGKGKLDEGERLWLMSDGFVLPGMTNPKAGLPFQIADELLTQYRNALHSGNIEDAFQVLRYIEKNDPLGNKLPRAKLHDDTTAIVINPEIQQEVNYG